MKQRLAGVVLWLLLCLVALPSLLLLPLLIWAGPIPWARDSLRGFDQFANATLFRGNPLETLSSHAWRDRAAPWAAFLVWFLDLIQPGHCQGANAIEQPILDNIDKQAVH